MTEQYNISNVSPINFEFQDYQLSDDTLIPSFLIENISFNPSINKIEVSFFNSDNSYIFSDYDLKSYSFLDSNITIDPESDIKSYLGSNSGTYFIVYNFIELLLNSSPTNTYYISEISSDRTELRLSSTNLSDEQIIEGTNNFIQQYNVSSSYFPDFYLNFGENNLVIANNILLQNNTVLIKLYEPLPENFNLKSQLWVVNKLANSIAYSVEVLINFDDEIFAGIPIKGPNFNISLKDQVNNTTDYLNYNTLQSSLSSSLTNQLNNVLKNKSIRLNIDYTDYNNFIHFSSAETRLENFYYKLTLIEDYNQQALSASLSPINNYLSSSQNIYLNKIKEIEEGFDGYEYHLYYSSGSTSWPKSNLTQPYINYPSTSSQGQTWLNGQLDTASIYDSENKDILINVIPLFLKEDPQNAPYELFIEMVGQHFDTLYLYYEEVANKYNSDNRIDHGVSRDVISDILRDFGIKIYQNNFSTDDLYSSFLGITNNLNLLPPTGSELITNYITASNDIIPLENVNIGTYKRIYHNLPLLFKKKGTVEGIKLLINLYGIPDTILSVNEFGGKNKINANDWDQFQNQFNYEFFTTSSGFISKAIPSGITSSSLSTVEFRFKTTGIPIATTSSFSQSLASFSGSSYNLVIEYTGSGYATGSYSSSIVNSEYQYGTLKLISGSISASVYLPIFDGNWWSVLTTCYAGTSSLYLKNKIYSGYDGNKIGFQASSSFTSSGFWINSVSASNFYLSYSSSKSIAGKTYTPFSGSFQELRFYSVAISESVFNDYVMNPYSIESNQLSGSQTSQATLIFRAPLGSELDISSSARISSHPGISYYPVTQSFSSGNSIYTFSGSYSFIPNTETIYLDQFPAGIKNVISNKIKIENTFIPAGDTLSALRSLQQNFEISQSYTNDINYAEVAFSPQNEINKDIISQLGYFNIGDYIGDPRQLVNKKTPEYSDFNQLRDQYFAKYSSSYNLVDYVRLIKYFDNSLFKLIKDFVPARTSLATGIVVKQHLLERNKYAPPQGSYEFEDYSGSVKSFPYDYEESPLYKLSVGPGGVMPELNGSTSSSFVYPGAINLTQSWVEPFVGPTGLSHIDHSDQKEFFDGELQGTELISTDGNLNGNNIFLSLVQPESNYKVRFYSFNTGSWYESIPGNGEINILASNPSSSGEAYIKMSKTDIQGNYYGLSLSYLDSFKIQYPTRTVEYNVLSKANYPNYMVYSYYPVLNTYPLDLNGIILEYSASASYSAGSVVAYIATGYANGGTTTFSSKAIIADAISYDALSYYTASYENPKTAIDVTASIYTIHDWINVPLFIEAQMELSADNGPGGNPWSGRILLFKFTPYNNSGIGSQPIFYDASINLNGGNTYLIAAGSVVGAASGLSATANLTALDSTPKKGDSYIWAFTSEDNATYITASNIYVNVKLANPSVYGLAQTGSSNLVFYNPYLPKPFEGGDYDSIYANVDKVEPSQYIESLDPNYLTNSLFFKYVMSGSSEKASVKDYYYTLEKHIRPRYKGSRSTQDGFNSNNTSRSLAIQSNQQRWLNPLLNVPTQAPPKLAIPIAPLGIASPAIASKFDTTLYEFNSITPTIEMLPFTRINVSKIINTDTTESAMVMFPNDDTFGFTKSNQFIGGDKIANLTFYKDNAFTLSDPTVVTTLFTPVETFIYSPSIPNGPSSFTSFIPTNSGNVWFGTITQNAPGNINGPVPLVSDANGNFTTGTPMSQYEFWLRVSSSLANNDEWYISFISGSIPIPLTPYNRNQIWPMDLRFFMPTASILSSSRPEERLFNSYGIFRIISASSNPAINQTTLIARFPNTSSAVSYNIQYGFNTTAISASACIWRNSPTGSNIILDKLKTNISTDINGYFTTQTVSPFIKNNANVIAEKFGTKPKP
jgi:hypothetical protein